MAVNQRKAGAILSYVHLALSTLVGLVYTPIMLRLLGQSEYGLFGTAASLTSFLSLLSFGMAGAYNKFVMEYRANEDKDGENRLNGLFLIMYSIVSMLVLIIGVVLVLLSDVIYQSSLNDYERSQVKIIMILTIVNTILTFVFIPVMMYIQSREEYLFLRVISLINTIINPIINLVALYFFPRAVVVSIITVILAVVTYVIYFIYASKKLDMRFSFRKLEVSVFKGIFVFSSFLFINELTNLITGNTDTMVLGIVSGTVVVAIYSVGSSLTSYLYTCSTSISGVFGPTINRIVANSKKDGTNPDNELNELFVKVGRLQFLILTLLLIGYISIGQRFIIIWAGEEYVNSFWIALLLMLAPYVPLMQNIGLEVQKAKNLHKVRSMVYFAVSIVNASATIPLAIFFSQDSFARGAGGIAAAAATFVSMLLGQGLFMNIYYHKKVGINIIAFWKQIFRMVPGVIIPLVVGVIINIFFPAQSYLMLLIEACVITVVYIISTACFSMNLYERSLLFTPIRIVKNKTKCKMKK